MRSCTTPTAPLKSFVRIPLKYRTPANARFLAAVDKVEAVIYDIIDSPTPGPDKNPDLRYDDLLDMLMHTRDEETGETMSDGQLRDEVTTIFMAGTRDLPPTRFRGRCTYGKASRGKEKNPFGKPCGFCQSRNLDFREGP